MSRSVHQQRTQQRMQQQSAMQAPQPVPPVYERKTSEQELKAYRKVVMWHMVRKYGNRNGCISVNTVVAANHSGLTREDLLLAMRNAKNDGFVRLISAYDDADEVYRFNGSAPTNEEKENANARAKIIRQEMQQAEQQAAMQAEQQLNNAHDDEIASDARIRQEMQFNNSVRSVCSTPTDNSVRSVRSPPTNNRN